MDVYAIVTEKIIDLLEQEIVPWRRPWTTTDLPRNLVSGKPYKGINHFLLSASKYVSPFWLTMRVWNLEQCKFPQSVLDKLPKVETQAHDRNA